MPLEGYPLVRRVVFGTDWTQKLQPLAHARISPAIVKLLEKPSWSVRSLLPPENSVSSQSEPTGLSRNKLCHFLKLSALPNAKTPEEADVMLKTLESQIHFVKEIQQVDTSGVEPLVAIRDETKEAIQENTVSLETLRPWLEKEQKVGRNGTVRRIRNTSEDRKMTWDPFDMGPNREGRQMGKYFYVKKGKKDSQDLENTGEEVGNVKSSESE